MMEEKLFQRCYKKYLTAEKGEAYWDDLADETDDYDTGEQLRCAVKNGRIKRGLPPKGVVIDKNGKVNPKKYESQQINGDGSIFLNKMFFISEEEAKDKKSILDAAGLNPDELTLVEAKFGAWDVYNGKPFRTGSIKVKEKKKKGISFGDVDKFFEDYKFKNPYTRKNILSHAGEGDKVLEIDFADFHVGSKSFYGNGVSVRKKTEHVISRILSKCKKENFSKIYLMLLGDILHFDSKARTTTGGTKVETNGMTNAEMFDETFDILVSAIIALSEIAEVEVISTSGNHDYISSYMLIGALDAYFKDDEHIIIDKDHLPRKTRVIGETLLGVLHGDISKKNMQSWLQVEARKEWGETKWSELHSAHIHHQKGDENGGINIRNVPSIADVDEWSYGKGFVGARKGVMSFVWDLKDGIEDTWFICVDNMED